MTPEQADLLRKAHQSHLAAELLAEKGFYDFSVARSYYTMFYLAEAFLLHKGLAFSKHSAVIAAFGREFVKTGIAPREFQGYLVDAEDSRKIGDYEFKPELLKDDAYLHLKHAARFLEVAESLLEKI